MGCAYARPDLPSVEDSVEWMRGYLASDALADEYDTFTQLGFHFEESCVSDEFTPELKRERHEFMQHVSLFEEFCRELPCRGEK
jgi:hypothetical protein